MKEQQLPTYEDLLWPTLRALDDRGGSASIHELSEHIASELALSDEILDVPHKDGPQTEVDYRAAWARTHLKLIGAADNTSRGVWTITSVGRGVQSEKQLREKVRQVRKKRAQERRHRKSVPGDDEEVREDQGWEDALLQIIRSGDGGIDGAGVLRVNLISFHVRFQCKRYTGSVGAREIRDFRGAMIGRADKGLFITTGRFTKDAEHEAVRDGAPAIDLIGGIDLCNLLRSLDLGVSTETVKVMKPKPEFFEGL